MKTKPVLSGISRGSKKAAKVKAPPKRKKAAAVVPENLLAGITRRGGIAMRNPGMPTQGKFPHSPIKVRNLIHFDVVGPDGKVKQKVRNVENIMVTYGLASAAKMLSTHTKSGSQWAQTMAIGTDATAGNSTQSGLLASTQLCGTFSRSDLGNMTARYLATFASDGNTASIREIGIMASNVGNDSMICRSALTGTQSVNRGASDQINVSYDIVFTTA